MPVTKEYKPNRVAVGASATDFGGKNAGGKAKAPTGKSGYLEVARNMKGGSKG